MPAAIVAIVAMFLAFLIWTDAHIPQPDYNVTTVEKTWQPLK